MFIDQWWLRGDKKISILAAFLSIGLAVLVYSLYNIGLPWRFNSPDEAANAYFARRLANGDGLTASAELNKITSSPIVHPRSTQIVANHLAPASFLGLPLLAGFIARLVGEPVLPYITPLGAALGLWCFWLIVRHLTNDKTAWLTTFILAITPAWWYYHSRSFFHNALFVDFLLLGIYALLQALRTKKVFWYILSGLAIGWALSLRTSEFFWLAASGVIWLGLNWRQLRWYDLPILIMAAVLAFSPVLIANYHIYGAIFSIGYRQELGQVTNLNQALDLLPQLIWPFGFHPRIILTTSINYLFKLSWWWVCLVGVGALYFLFTWRRQSLSAKSLFVAMVVATVWLVVVYGSWQFNDNPNPQAVTLGTSYVRYWLPIYVFWLWPAGMFLADWTNRRWGRVAVMTIVGSYLVLSVSLVWWRPEEGLLWVRANIKRFQQWNEEVRLLTEDNSVIVTGFTDKIFWPDRQVIYNLSNRDDFRSAVELLRSHVPVYWFHPTWRPSEFVVIQRRLSDYGLFLTPLKYGWYDFSLYKLSLIP